MVFSTFVKLARAAQGPQFFDSSYPRPRTGLVTFERIFKKTNFGQKRARRHATADSSFFSIDKGHYGLYYTIYNHNGGQIKISPANYQLLYENEPVAISEDENVPPELPERFFILRVARETSTRAQALRGLSQTRSFLTKINLDGEKERKEAEINKHDMESNEVDIKNNDNALVEKLGELKLESEKIVSFEQKTPLSDAEIARDSSLDVSKDNSIDQSSSMDPKLPFEEHLLAVQSAQINALASSTDPTVLDAVYPLYQSLKRNDINLPSVELYNSVLRLFSVRSCDNSVEDVPSIEARLTNLLTVYLDLLGSGLRPSTETYLIVLQTLFAGCWSCVRLFGAVASTENLASNAYQKAPEFVRVAVELYACSTIPEEAKRHPEVIKNMCLALSVFPEVVTPGIVATVVKCAPEVVPNSPDFYPAVLGLARYFKLHQLVLEPQKEAYNYVNAVFASYKAQTVKEMAGETEKIEKIASSESVTFLSAEYLVYTTMIQALILNDNAAVATKFVDDILHSYRSKIDANVATSEEKASVSLLLLTYIKSLVARDPTHGLEAALELVQRFNELAYVPELSVDLYNDLITRLVLQLTRLQQQVSSKGSKSPELHQNIVARIQQLYTKTWALYSYVAIRKDYHAPLTSDATTVALGHPFTGKARDFLLSYSIDTADHEKVFMLLKELVLKNHLVRDFTVFRKTVSYLYNGAFSGNTLHKHYFDLMWSAIESQALHYAKDSASTHYFLSGVAQFVRIPPSASEEAAMQCIRALCNSTIVTAAFENFSLERDNIFGLMSITNDMIRISKSVVEPELLQKLTQLQSQLINELEDTENHYLALSQEITDFKAALLVNFRNSMNQLRARNLILTPEMVDACRHANLDFEDTDLESLSTLEGPKFVTPLNLVYQLRVNYNVGALRVEQALQKGQALDSETWNLLATPYFVENHLSGGSGISVLCFMARLMAAGGPKDKVDILCRLVLLNNDKVNIEILRFLLKSEIKNIDSVYSQILKAFSTTENIYLREMVLRNISFILLNTLDEKANIALFLAGLKAQSRFQNILEFVEARTGFAGSLSQELELDVMIMESYLQALLETGRSSDFNSIFSTFFKNRTTISSTMKELLIQNCTYSGMYDVVAQKFPAKSVLRAPESTKDLLLFNDFMRTLSNARFQSELAVVDSPRQQVLQILMHRQWLDMVEAYSDGSYSSSAVINEAMDILVKAAEILANQNQTGQLSALDLRFHAFLNTLKHAGVTKMTTQQLLKVIKFYSVIGRNDMINILLNKITAVSKNGTVNIVPMLDYYFMEVSLYTSTKHQLQTVFEQFRLAFERTKNHTNKNIIYDLCEHYKLKLGTTTP